MNAVGNELLGTAQRMSERDYYIRMIQAWMSYCDRASSVMSIK